MNNLESESESNTVCVLLTDIKYFSKARRTIIDLRSVGAWYGDLVLITIDFKLSPNFAKFYNITEVSFPEIPGKAELIENVKGKFANSDGREVTKINQWEKFHVFDEYFTKWRRVVYFDAGLRILDSISYLLELDYSNALLAPNDAGNSKKPEKVFAYQISMHNPELTEKLYKEFGSDIIFKQYFLNCIWIYDTSILEVVKKDELIRVMQEYPLCKTNENTVMVLVFQFKYNLWREFPSHAKNGKYLFDWCELNNPGSRWSDYCLLKYPVTISFEDC